MTLLRCTVASMLDEFEAVAFGVHHLLARMLEDFEAVAFGVHYLPLLESRTVACCWRIVLVLIVITVSNAAG